MQGLDALSPHGARLLLGTLVKQVSCSTMLLSACTTLLHGVTASPHSRLGGLLYPSKTCTAGRLPGRRYRGKNCA